ncbi:hypothetical protein SOVF_144220 isoform A [Spinacia oleracea]|nr:hypothetical protein SOVF_144220 isoform A [Spinacia oleracea]
MEHVRGVRELVRLLHRLVGSLETTLVVVLQVMELFLHYQPSGSDWVFGFLYGLRACWSSQARNVKIITDCTPFCWTIQHWPASCEPEIVSVIDDVTTKSLDNC